ncbi:apolipoprotein N-acyltransferase [Thauera phenolivorans]|uniref:apolipoprotein N-acyltransferase n=1 Tax=Thauera phenolivorans TaxID=1792543 RepID=UPI00083A507C|nr:apolipoprotein N-acyltransferase [Thauera phenolivorans]
MTMLPLLPHLHPDGRWRWVATGAAGGLGLALAQAPVAWWPAAPLGLAVLAGIVLRAPGRSQALAGGIAFGVGAWLPVLGWLYSGIEPDHAAWFAYGAPTLVIAAFAAGPAACSLVAHTLHARPALTACLLLPALWAGTEWLRQLGSFRFPWAPLGHTQVEAPLAGLAPLIGGLGVGLLTVALGGAIALICLGGCRTRKAAALSLLAILAAAELAARIEWTRPAGAPLRAALMQGGYAGSEKFDSDGVVSALQRYAEFTLHSRARVAILPETALPLLEHELPPGYLDVVERRAREQNRDVLLGLFRRTEDDPRRHHNSARIVGASGAQTYDKTILLPFGETIPAAAILRPLFERIARVPMLDAVPGSRLQPAPVLGGIRIGLRLCFEDLFGDAAREASAAAGYLVVLSNDSWDGSDLPMHQHLPAAQMRALEAAKPLLRVANTGWTASIRADGRIDAVVPPHQPAVLETTLQPRIGITPYVRHGDAIPLGLAALAFSASLSALPGARHGRARDARSAA